MFWCTYVCISVGYVPMSELLGHRVVVAIVGYFSQFSQVVILFFPQKWLYSFSLPLAMCESPCHSVSLPVLDMVSFLNFYPFWWVCSGILWWCYFAFPWLRPLSYVYIAFGCPPPFFFKWSKCSRLTHFLIGCLAAFFLICKNSLHFLDTILFFGYMCYRYLLCRFAFSPFLMVSFDKQKFLIFRSVCQYFSCGWFWKTLPTLTVMKIFSNATFRRSAVKLSFSFRAVIWFLCIMCIMLNFIFLMLDSKRTQHSLLERLSYPHSLAVPSLS